MVANYYEHNLHVYVRSFLNEIGYQLFTNVSTERHCRVMYWSHG